MKNRTLPFQRSPTGIGLDSTEKLSRAIQRDTKTLAGMMSKEFGRSTKGKYEMSCKVGSEVIVNTKTHLLLAACAYTPRLHRFCLHPVSTLGCSHHREDAVVPAPIDSINTSMQITSNRSSAGVISKPFADFLTEKPHNRPSSLVTSEWMTGPVHPKGKPWRPMVL